MRNKIKAINGLQLLVFPPGFPRRVSRRAMRCTCPPLTWGKTSGGDLPAPCSAGWCCPLRSPCETPDSRGSWSKVCSSGFCLSAGWQVLPWFFSSGGCGWPGVNWPLPYELFNISRLEILCKSCLCCLIALFCAGSKAENRIIGMTWKLWFLSLDVTLARCWV